MIRTCMYILILASLLFAPVDRLEVALLEPVEIIYVSQTGGVVAVTTDTGAQGSGEGVRQALQALHATTAGVVYLDTAEYLLFNSEAAAQVEQLRGCIKEDVRVCIAEAVNFEGLGKFLQSHGYLPCFRDWKPGDPLPELKDGKIVENTAKNA